jgi:hypothetical protein
LGWFLGGTQRTLAEGRFVFRAVVAVGDSQLFAQTPADEVLFNTDLRDGAARLYGAVWFWHWRKQHPTQSEMAKLLGWSVAKVWRVQQELENAGLTEQRKAGYGKPNTVVPLCGPISSPVRTLTPHQRGDRTLTGEGITSSPVRERGVVDSHDRESEADDENARAVDRAGSQDNSEAAHRWWVLNYLEQRGSIREQDADEAKPWLIPTCEKLVGEGLVEEAGQPPHRMFTLRLTQEATT